MENSLSIYQTMRQEPRKTRVQASDRQIDLFMSVIEKASGVKPLSFNQTTREEAMSGELFVFTHIKTGYKTNHDGVADIKSTLFQIESDSRQTKEPISCWLNNLEIKSTKDGIQFRQKARTSFWFNYLKTPPIHIRTQCVKWIETLSNKPDLLKAIMDRNKAQITTYYLGIEPRTRLLFDVEINARGDMESFNAEDDRYTRLFVDFLMFGNLENDKAWQVTR